MNARTTDREDAAADPLPAVRRVVVVLNPAAGRGRGRARGAELQRLLAGAAGSLPCRWSIIETTGPGGGAEAARAAAQAGSDIVAAAGGDGTLGEVANGLVGTGARLGVLPLGTGNDFARSLAIGADLALGARTLFEGEPRAVDLGRVVVGGERWFLNVAGCGFDAAVAERVNRGFRWLRGTPAYVAAVFQTLATYRAAEMRVTVDGEARTLRAMLCCVANAQYYGGGMRVAPDARLDDGLLDVCLLAEGGRVEFLRAFPSVFRGAHVTHPRVTMLRGRRVTVETERPMPVFVDGEAIGTTPAEFACAPAAIEVMTPRAEWLREAGGGR